MNSICGIICCHRKKYDKKTDFDSGELNIIYSHSSLESSSESSNKEKPSLEWNISSWESVDSIKVEK